MLNRKLINCLSYTCVFVMLLCSTSSFAGTIIGTVIDAKSGTTLPGVNIMIEGTVLGASSNLYGEFRIVNVPPGRYSLRASMIGHHPQTKGDVLVQQQAPATVNFELQQAVIDFDPLVVSANKTRQSLDNTPNSLSVLQAPDIQKRMSLRIDDALEAIPGVNFVHDQINIRGSTGFTIGAANRTLLLVDGVPVMTSDTGQFNWDLLPVLDVEQIEVIKGAGSSLYGTAALGGVINVITKPPSEEGKTIIRVIAGEYGQPRYPEWVWTNTPLLFGRVDVSHSRQIGQLGYRFSVARHTSTGYTEVGDFKRWNATGKLTWHFKNGSEWMFFSAYNFNEGGIYVGWDDSKKPFQVLPANRNSRGKIEMANIYSRIKWILSPKASLQFRVSYIMSLMGNQFINSADFNPARGLGSEIIGSWIPTSHFDITYGSEFKWDTGNTKYFGDHKGYTIGVFGQIEYRAFDEKLRITPGVRYDRYQLINGLSQSLTSPRFGINYRPFQSTVLRASAGTGFRAATIAERYLNFESSSVIIKANPDLQAETAWSMDAGWRQYIKPTWFVEVGAFRNDFKNLVEVDLKQSQIEFGRDIRVSVQFKNLQDARIEGLEFTTGGSWLKNHLQVQATTTIMDHNDLTTGEPLTYRPKVIAYINPSVVIGAWEFQAEYQYASRMEKVKLYQYDERVPKKVWNLRVLYHLGPVTFQVSANNALDYYYTEFERNMAEIRHFVVGMTGTF
ncbi:TonB-dependent receptor [candidate division KSB1 bacterium]|nr:TonB-dependent receptor [candidate division KSB1 bacterium]